MARKTSNPRTVPSNDPTHVIMSLLERVNPPKDGLAELTLAVHRLAHQTSIIEHPIEPATPADLKRAAQIVDMLTFAIGMPTADVWKRISQAWDVVGGQPSLADRRLRTVQAIATSIEQKRAGNLVSYGQLKHYLVTCDMKFGNAADAQLKTLIERAARDGGDTRGGAGRIGAPYVASRVAAKVGAFGDSDADESQAAFRAAISKSKAKRVTAR